MEEVIIVEDRVDMQCVRRVHLMANEPIVDSTLHPFSTPTTAKIEQGETAGSHWLKAEWGYRGVLDITTEGGVKFRRFVVWNLEGCENVREALKQAKAEYGRLFGGSPQFGIMRSLPRGVDWFTEFEGMLLLDAEWMLERSVAVGGMR